MLWFMTSDGRLKRSIKKINKERKAYLDRSDEIINDAKDFVKKLTQKTNEMIDAFNEVDAADIKFDKVYKKYANIKNFEAENIRSEYDDDDYEEFDDDEDDDWEYEEDDDDDDEDSDDEISTDMKSMSSEEFRNTFMGDDEEDDDDEDATIEVVDEVKSDNLADDTSCENETEKSVKETNNKKVTNEAKKSEPVKQKVDMKDVYTGNRKSTKNAKIIPAKVLDAGNLIKSIVLEDTEFDKINDLLNAAGYTKTMVTDDNMVSIYKINDRAHIEVTKMPESGSYMLSVRFKPLFVVHGDAHIKYAKEIFGDGEIELISSESGSGNSVKAYGYNEDYLINIIISNDGYVEIMFCAIDDDDEDEE